MSKVFTAKQLCEEALGAIGAFPVTESAADPEHLRRAMLWLDLILGELAGTTRLFALVPAAITLHLEPGQGTYNLVEELGADLPVDRIQFPVAAYLEDGAGNRRPLDIVTRDRFEAVDQPNRAGPPEMIYIDRLAAAPTLRTYPTVAATDLTDWTIRLDVQTYAPNVAPGGVTGTQPAAAVLTNFRQAWQRYLIKRLCIDLATGPITKLPKTSIDEFRIDAKQAKDALDAFENREHETTPPICEPWGL